jgi:hypothetical protein
MKWHLELPSDCPPDDAQPASGEFYRYVQNDPPQASDLLSQRELKPECEFDQPECVIRSVSIFRHKEDAIAMSKRVSLFRKPRWKLAVGSLKPKHGVVMNTPFNEQSHHSWWIAAECEHWKAFRVIAREN